MTGNGVTVQLTGKVALVTGGGAGLGAAYACALAAAGAAVVVNDLDAASAERTAADVVAAGGRAVVQTGAVGTSPVAQALVDRAVAEFGRLDILVSNAGILRDAMLWKMTDEQFDDVVRVHLRGTFTCVRAAAIRMRAQGGGGRIICVGSPTGQVGNVGQTNYAAAKAGIVGMTRTWAMELSRSGITVNAVIPVAATGMTATVPFLRPYVDTLADGGRLPRYARQDLGFGTPDDVAGLVVFLASEAADAVTGQAIGIGGDRLALWTHPHEAVVELADGTGWSAEAVAAVWPDRFAPHAQPVGQQLPAAETVTKEGS